VSELQLSANDFKGLWCSHEEFCRLLDIEMSGNSKLEIDAVGASSLSHEVSFEMNCSLLDKLKIVIKLFKKNFDEEKLHEIMMTLVEAQRESGENYLFECIQNGTLEEIKDLVMILVKYKLLDVLKSLTELDQNCLHLSILAGHYNLLKVFLKLAVDVNQADAFGNTAMHLAVIQKSQECVEILLTHVTNINVDELNDDGFAPLHLAVRNNDFPTVRLLVEFGADVMRRCPQTGENVLHMAITSEQVNLEMIRYLIEHDDQLLHQQNNSRMNSLQLAAINNRPDNLVDFLSKFYAESFTSAQSNVEDGNESDSDNENVNGQGESLFDERCLRELTAIFDKNQKWEALVILMELEDKIDEWSSSSSPSRSIFNHLVVSSFEF
jgi:ankyrin repeat protein